MELSTTTRGKAKLLWNGYTKHTEKNDMIRWHCTCHASKLCPASAYTDLLPAYPVLKIDHNHCPEPMKLEVIFFKEICLYRIFIGFTKMPCYQNVGYQDVLLPKCLLPKCPVTEMSVTKTSITKVSFTEMSGYLELYTLLNMPPGFEVLLL
jgi:hypothetical protein